MRGVTARLSVDIGGTFTDIVVEVTAAERNGQWSTKLLTTPDAPERAVLDGVGRVLGDAGLAPSDVDLFVHGTTLATNAIIERRGACTGLLTTDGFRDTIAMAQENRFEQYDVDMVRPEPLVPRHLRLGVPERIAATGEVLVALDEAAVRAAAHTLVDAGVESVAVGYLHAYRNAVHEQRTRELLAAEAPQLWVTLSSDVCPEIREYERFSTACANAYVQPLVSSYLRRLAEALRSLGVAGPLFLLSSSGGLCTFDTGEREPVRLVESGPAGGALLAAEIARRSDLDRVVSFDMGGTTAKLCLIEQGEPQTSRSFEVARLERFLPGSGLPLRIPVIEMVEIGAGGGSIASVDTLGRVQVGPRSAGSVPGPACYGLGGANPTVTDADVALGRIDPEAFAGGSLALDASAAATAIATEIGAPLGLAVHEAAFGIGEVVDEHMANAARVHAIERGFDAGDHTLVAFGGAAPLHAARVAAKLGITTVVVPEGAGVGSAIGFLRAPVAYEVVRTLYQRLDAPDLERLSAMLVALRDEAHEVVASAAPGTERRERFTVDLRYVGQGHEVRVVVPPPPWGPDELAATLAAFEAEYRRLFTRTIAGLAVEALTWTVQVVADPEALPPPGPPPARRRTITSEQRRRIFDAGSGVWVQAAVVERTTLEPGDHLLGPAVVTEAQTTTVVPPGATCELDADRNLVIRLGGQP